MEARDLALRESGGGGDKLMELCTAALLARLSRCAVFTRALEPTEGWFQHEQRALDSGSGALLRQCEKERTNIRTQRRREETQIAVADVGSKDAEERIRQLKDKTPQEPDRAASLQDTGGPLRDENGLLKAETVRPCAKRKRGPEHTKGRAQRPVARKCATAAFRAHRVSGQLPLRRAPATAVVGFRGTQGLRDALGEAPFTPAGNIRTREGALEYMMPTLPEHFLRVCHAVFQMLPKDGCLAVGARGEMEL
ncbi:hypothetical protein ERJ75_000644400 [Trypanosoma vivax]|nr:hypothetical protein ERJ75_000644400 [Trypanosoma vivax]